MNRKSREKIRKIVGKDHSSDRAEDMVLYAYDAMNRRYMPDMVAHPEGAREVAAIMLAANEEGFPVIPRGAGTGLTGGSLAVDGGLVITMDRMNRILDIDEENMTAWVESGVINGDLQKEAEKRGLFFPPDPSSADFSTLGGNAAENAGGSRAVKYGVTRDYVMGMEVVTPTGQIIHTGSSAIKSVTGYDLTRLMVGSEGTLGIITKLLLRLIPRPETTGTMLAGFSETGIACKAVIQILRSSTTPSTLEIMDRSAVDCVREYLDMELPEGTAALLLIEVDGSARQVEEQVRDLNSVCEGVGVTFFKIAATEAERNSLWKARKSLSPAIMKIRPLKINEDVAVPRMKIPDLIRGVEGISKKWDIITVTFGHAGDGNVHVNFLLDPDDPDEVQRAHSAVGDLFQLTVDLGGSLTGEHGIGIAKAPYLGIEVSQETVEVMRSIKRALDPNNVLNPHKTFDFDTSLYSREIATKKGNKDV